MTETRSVLDCATFELVDSFLLYVPLTGKLYWKVSPSNVIKSGSEAGTLDIRSGYLRVCIDGMRYGVHRIAHLLMTGHWPDRNPEHENLDKTDNRWENIKDLAPGASHNGGHRGLFRNNTSGLKGVCWNRGKRKWNSQIGVHHATILIGRFDDPRLAGLTYDAAAKLAWGRRFSCLNFPWEESDHIVLPERVIQRIGAFR
jgi:hypothetical protein